MKKVMSGNSVLYLVLMIAFMFVQPYVWAGESNCFSSVKYVTPKDNRATRALYVLVDETVPLSDDMKKRVEKLLSGWGQAGDQVKIARFSASYRGLYPELIYSKKIDPMPDDNFMFNLHYKDKKSVMKCMEMQKEEFKTSFAKALKASLKNINPKIPKSELLGSLKLLSKQLVSKDDAIEKTILLISDGLENSNNLSFYSKKVVKSLNPRKEIAKLRRKGLMGYWKNANVYMYGVGLMPDKKRYSKPENVLKLKRFWEHYFVESGAKVKEIGTPELMLTSIE